MSNFFLAPQVSAEVLTTTKQREDGCIVLDLGMGCTSVAVYKQGKLIHVSVIPLGGVHITNDLLSLNLQENEVEGLKGLFGEKYGQDTKGKVLKFANDSMGNERILEISEIQKVCSKRLGEILAYAMQAVRGVADPKELAAGIIVTGGLSRIANIDKIVAELSGLEAHVGSYVSTIATDSDGNCANYSAQLVGLLHHATDNCVKVVEEPKKSKKKSSFINKIGSLFDDNY